jgi:hypothetical protein
MRQCIVVIASVATVIIV